MLAFMGTTIIADVLLHPSSAFMHVLEFSYGGRHLAAVVCGGMAMVAAHSRVAGGHHTHAQVWVGFAVGTFLGVFWAHSEAFPAAALDVAVFGGGHRRLKAVVLVLIAVAAMSVKWLPAHSHSRPTVKSQQQ
jgi:hypothetical protein